MNAKVNPLTEGTSIPVNIEVAKLTDLESALILGQIHYWLQIKESNHDEQSFHDGRYWVYNSVKKREEQLPCLSYDTIKRRLRKLRNMGILIVGDYNQKSYDKSLWYTIDYDLLNELIYRQKQDIPLGQNAPTIGANCTNGLGQNAPTNTIDYTLDYNKEINGASSPDARDGVEASPQNCRLDIEDGEESFLHQQVFVSLRNNGMEEPYTCNEVIRIICYFFRKYQDVFSVPHVRLSQATMDNVVSKLLEGSDLVDDTCYETYTELIDHYFESDLECDYHITHFVSGHVRDYRWYEAGMGGGILSS